MSVIYSGLLVTEFVLALPIFIILMFIKAPYGKFVKRGWGPAVNASASWFLMEIPAVILPLYFFLTSEYNNGIYVFFIIVWEIHYVQRTFIYPFLLNRGSHKVPLLIILFSAVFNTVNGFINGYGIFILRSCCSAKLSVIRIIAGTLIFITGFVINMYSDHILRNLRKPGETGYLVPQGGLFKYICSPHYFGEILEWTGWTVLTWAPAAAAFLAFTAANLVPRASANLKWYRSEFPDFPAKIKAIFPGIY